MKSGAPGAATYRLVVRGELDPRFAYLFDGMAMERVEGTTVLTGKVIDQAQLHGFIARTEELGLELLYVGKTGEPASAPTSERGKSER
jgi:hypothetical protein